MVTYSPPGPVNALCHSLNLPLFFLSRPFCSLLANHNKNYFPLFLFFLGWQWNLKNDTTMTTLTTEVNDTSVCFRVIWLIADPLHFLIVPSPHPFPDSKFIPGFSFPRFSLIILSCSLHAQDSNHIKNLSYDNIGGEYSVLLRSLYEKSSEFIATGFPVFTVS